MPLLITRKVIRRPPVHPAGSGLPKPQLGAYWLQEVMEECLGGKEENKLLRFRLGDGLDTCADVDALVRDTGYCHSIAVADGAKRAVDWDRMRYRLSELRQ